MPKTGMSYSNHENQTEDDSRASIEVMRNPKILKRRQSPINNFKLSVDD